ncbi:nitroreductase family deazaflavin-dependent oxidoreductase [Mycolicibacterium alvei]|jgi:deazaflavin-dependent oxidoreductase (nitroreductase family)|uniref:Nitroreductase n=2 Tax=Mycolicibacterium alvei TaxID=67081 RepID=A0A6N4V1Y1_9MYCO|nr:nitroreductase family deazaflavin-dependent oxidoreductase [Mycolicibacterium alvei]MCV7000525.1 nitroreductase family deazaflavin-dependent oxidoreductase [Mycolicibacterium alvei]BBX29897.1 nitroreductase [Mycolicibacterium alvei]
MSMPWWERYIGLPMLLLHDKIYKATDGRIGHTIPGGPPALILHTVGAKTGKQRANSLTYAKDGADYLVVASKGGEPTSPGWYHNLKAKPQVEINVGPKRLGVTARPVLPGDPDYPRLWELVNNMRGNKNRYIGYQKRTTRPIPVVVLTP